MTLASLILQNGSFSYFLSILYLAAAVIASFRFHHVRKTAGMLSPGTLFVGSLLFATVVRTFSFGSLAIFSLSSVSIPDTDSLNSADPVTRFYVSALDVLLATGDFVSLNTYLFLVVLWVDIAQKARQHFLSTRRLRCGWMTGYLSFSVFTYILSFVLFILHFVSSANSTTYLDAIYYSLAIFDVLVPFLLAVVYIYSLCALAGFPYTSEAARKRMVQVTRIVVLWSAGRVLFSVSFFLSLGHAWVTLVEEHSEAAFAVVLTTIFFLSEILPFFITLMSQLVKEVPREKPHLLSPSYTPPLSDGSTKHTAAPLLTSNTEDEGGRPGTAATKEALQSDGDARNGAPGNRQSQVLLNDSGSANGAAEGDDTFLR